MLGNSGFVKLDFSLTPKHFLTARAEHVAVLRDEQRLFDPSSPITNYAISSNGEEDVKTESASLALAERTDYQADESSARCSSRAICSSRSEANSEEP